MLSMSIGVGVDAPEHLCYYWVVSIGQGAPHRTVLRLGSALLRLKPALFFKSFGGVIHRAFGRAVGVNLALMAGS